MTVVRRVPDPQAIDTGRHGCWRATTPSAALVLGRVGSPRRQSRGLVADQVVEPGEVQSVAGDVELDVPSLAVGGHDRRTSHPPCSRIALTEHLVQELRAHGRVGSRGEPHGLNPWRPRLRRACWALGGLRDLASLPGSHRERLDARPDPRQPVPQVERVGWLHLAQGGTPTSRRRARQRRQRPPGCPHRRGSRRGRACRATRRRPRLPCRCPRWPVERAPLGGEAELAALLARCLPFGALRRATSRRRPWRRWLATEVPFEHGSVPAPSADSCGKPGSSRFPTSEVRGCRRE